jgi:hypothetical protein
VLRGLRSRAALWVAFVITLFVALAVVIALASPGPWHALLPTARADLVSAPPADVAVYLDGGGAAGPRCHMILWLHLRYGRPALAVVVVPPDVLVPRADLPAGLLLPLGAGSVSLGDLVERSGPAAGTQALGRLLGVHVGGWLIVNRDALLQSLGAVSAANKEALGGAGRLTEAAFRRQVGTLRALVTLAPRKAIPVHAFENYVLASGEVSTSLGLHGVASLGKVLRDAVASAVSVLALPAEAAGGEWHAEPGAVRALVTQLRGH